MHYYAVKLHYLNRCISIPQISGILFFVYHNHLWNTVALFAWGYFKKQCKFWFTTFIIQLKTFVRGCYGKMNNGIDETCVVDRLFFNDMEFKKSKQNKQALTEYYKMIHTYSTQLSAWNLKISKNWIVSC